MRTYIASLDELPSEGQTIVRKSEKNFGALAGPVLNMARTFKSLGKSFEIMSSLSKADRREVVSEFGPNVDTKLLVTGNGTDILHSALHNDKHFSVYSAHSPQLPQLSDSVANTTDVIVFSGSRDNAYHRWFEHCITMRDKHKFKICFAPNYALYEYEKNTMLSILKSVDLLAVNRDESKHICELEGMKHHSEIADKYGFLQITTFDENGAEFRLRGEDVNTPAQSKRRGDHIGAGDRLLASFLTIYSSGASLVDSAEYASSQAAAEVKCTTE